MGQPNKRLTTNISYYKAHEIVEWSRLFYGFTNGSCFPRCISWFFMSKSHQTVPLHPPKRYHASPIARYST